jgi:capsular polysaccharide biosynthesis protein
MQEYRHIAAVAKGWKTIFLFGIVCAVAGMLVSFAFPLRYSSTMRLLIIQRQLSQADPYTAIKASERISDNLGQIIYTTSFFDKVLSAKFNIDQGYFKQDENKRRKQWHDMIATQTILGSGLLQVTVYHPDADQATQIARAIAFVLTTEGWKYVGGGDLQVQLVDEPLQSKYPVKPNIPANGVMGFVLGVMVGTGYVLYLGERRRVFGIPV